MQYKIPVQIENEDPIVLWLSLRQLLILMIWLSIAYWIFSKLEPSLWTNIALLPSWFLAFIVVMIAIFKINEMTFIPFVLNLLRLNINSNQRVWSKYTDSFDPLRIGIITKKSDKEIDLDIWKINKKEKIDKLSDSLNKI